MAPGQVKQNVKKVLDVPKMKYVVVSGGEFLFYSPRLGTGLAWTRRWRLRGGQRPALDYVSVIKSLEHSAMRCGKKLNLIWVNASHLEDESKTTNPAEFRKAWHEVCYSCLAGLGYAARRV
jgi:hypothetical protein